MQTQSTKQTTMRLLRSFSLLAALAVMVWSSGLAFIPRASAAEQPIRLGSRDAIRQSGLSEEALREALMQPQATVQQSPEATIGAESITGAPNLTQTIVQPTTTWGFLTDQASDASGKIFVAYIDTRDGSTNGGQSLYLRRSLDGGATWQTEQRVDNTTGAGTVFSGMNIATDGTGNVYLVWDDTRNGGETQLFFTRSRDAGVTWSSPALLVAASDVQDNIDMIVNSQGHVFITWEDDRGQAGSDSRIMSIYSSDFGTTWSPEQIIDDGGAGNNERGPVAVYGRTGEIGVAWSSDRGANDDLFYAFSADNGATWSADAQLDGGAGDLTTWDLCSDMNGSMYSFMGHIDGTSYARVSNDFGKTFPVAPVELTGTGLTSDGTATGDCLFKSKHAIVAFEGGLIPTGDLYAVTSNDGGVTWSAPARMDVSDAAGSNVIAEVEVDIDSAGRMLVAWDETRGVGSCGIPLCFDGFFNYSLDNGTTWQSSDFRFAGGDATVGRDIWLTDSLNNEYEGVTENGRGTFQLTWRDTRADNPGIWYGSMTFDGAKMVMDRHAGADRVLTGIEISKDSFPTAGTASAVVIATSGTFADGLPGGVLANQVGGPLLINPQGSLNSSVAAEILRVLDKKVDPGFDVYLLGGTAAISSGVEAAIDALDPSIDIKRLPGTDRVDTALKIAEEGNILRGKGPNGVILAVKSNFPDALVASTIGSSAGVTGDYWPVLISGPTLDPRVSAYLSTYKTTIAKAHVLGGTSVLPASFVTAVTAIIPTTMRHSGANRFATATAAAEFFYTGQLAPMSFGLANGLNFPDSLTGGAHSGKLNRPLVLARPTTVPTETSDWVVKHQDTLDTGTVYGGTAAISDAVMNFLNALI
jgi:hypothetical protein